MMQNKPLLLVLIGPTASGKTSTAIDLAKILNLEIISADSRYFYKELEIGTAKPSDLERALVPHHLINVTDLNHPWSLAQFKAKALCLVEEINKNGKIPILVGGTGQYVRAITEGWEIPPSPKSTELRDQITAWGEDISALKLHQKLSIVDSKAAANIDYQNLRRTVRALEVVFSSGIRFSEQRRKSKSVFKVLMLGINYPRDVLYQRIDDRITKMIRSGFANEVNKLLESGFESNLRSIAPIGYIEMIDFLRGRCTLQEAEMLIKRKTRVFVRRQANWFKLTDPQIKWFSPSDTLIYDMVEYIQSEIYLK